jgi:hypothetical protein
MKAKTLVILEMAINVGVKRGWHRAHKHIENPNEGTICDNIEREIMNELFEYFEFEDGNEIST